MVLVATLQLGGQLRVLENLQHFAGLLLHDPNVAVLAVTACHGYLVGLALAGVERDREGAALHRAGRPTLLEQCKLVIGPRTVFTALQLFDARCRVQLDEFLFDREVEYDLEHAQDVVGSTRRLSAGIPHLADVAALQQVQGLVAVLPARDRRKIPVRANGPPRAPSLLDQLPNSLTSFCGP